MNTLKEFSISFPCIAAIAIMTILSGCAAQGVNHNASELDKTAILDWSGWNSGDVLEIDGNKQTNQNHAELSPGKHTVRYGGRIGTSFLLNPKMSDSYEYSATIDMLAGHTYKVVHERSYGYGNYKDYFWIEDADTGEIVAGYLPEYKRENLERSEEAALSREIKNHFEALSSSAECGDASAQYDLGLYFLAGIPPVEKPDIVVAFVWYSLAALNGYKDAQAVKENIIKDMPDGYLSETDRLIDKLKKADCKKETRNPSLRPSNPILGRKADSNENDNSNAHFVSR